MNIFSYKKIFLSIVLGLFLAVVVSHIHQHHSNIIQSNSTVNGTKHGSQTAQSDNGIQFTQNKQMPTGKNTILTEFQDFKGNFWIASRSGSFSDLQNSEISILEKPITSSDSNSPKFGQQNLFKYNHPLTFGKYFFLEDNGANILFATPHHGLWYKKSGTQNFKQNSQIDSKANVVTIFKDRANILWIGLDDDTWWWETNVNTGSFQNSNIPHSNLISSAPICQDAEGNLWVGTYYRGLWEKKANEETFVENPQMKKQFPEPWDGPDVSIVFIDKQNNLWITVNGNIIWEKAANSDKFISLGKNCNHKGIFLTIEGFYQDSEGTIWLSSGGYGIWAKKLGASQFVQNSEMDQNSQILNPIFQDRDHNLWATTLSRGLWEKQARKASGSETKWRQAQGIPPKSNPNTIVQDSKGNLIVSGLYWSCGIYEKPKGESQFKQNSQIIGSSASSIDNLFLGKDGSLWVSVNYQLWTSVGDEFLVNVNYDNVGYVPPPSVSALSEIFRNDLFSVIISGSDISNITVNGTKIDNKFCNLGAEINFHNPIFSVKPNYTITLVFNYKNKSEKSTTRQYLIKSKYSDTGRKGKSDDIRDAVSEKTGTKIKMSKDVFLKNDPTQTKYTLLWTLAVKHRSNSVSNPVMKIFRPGFNFLTSFSTSSYENITIQQGKITQGKKSYLTTEAIYISGSNTNNIYEVDLIDFLGYKQKFLMQVGGNSLNSNFLIPKNIIWVYVVSAIGGIAVIFLVFIMFLSFQKKRRFSLSTSRFAKQATNKTVLKLGKEKIKKIELKNTKTKLKASKQN